MGDRFRVGWQCYSCVTWLTLCGVCSLTGCGDDNASSKSSADAGVTDAGPDSSTTSKTDASEAGSINACGGSSRLQYKQQSAEPGSVCGRCNLGTLICASQNALACLDNGPCDDAGVADTGTRNACGGSASLQLDGSTMSPGSPCGPCNDGWVICAAPDVLACVGASPSQKCADAEAPQPNVCGGTGALLYDSKPAAPGQACGPCEDGVLTCTSAWPGLECAGATTAGYCDNPSNSPNSCGGRGPTKWLGKSSSRAIRCGPCDAGALACATHGELVCVNNPPASCGEQPADTACTIPAAAYTTIAPVPPPAPPEPKPTVTTSVVLPIYANELVYNPFDLRMYASVPGAQGSNGNSIAVINPGAQTIEKYIAIGSDPRALALSDDGEVLWVYNAGNGTIKDIELSTGTVGQGFAIDASRVNSVYLRMMVVPGTHDSLLVVNNDDLLVYDAGVPRPYGAKVSSASVSTSPSPSLAFAFGGAGNAVSFWSICLNERGAFIRQSSQEIYPSSASRFVVADWIAYSGSGAVYDIRSQSTLGTFGVYNSGVVADPSTRRVFFFHEVYEQIQAFDMDNFVARGSESYGDGYYHTSLLRWGRYGFAYLQREPSGSEFRVKLIRSALIP